MKRDLQTYSVSLLLVAFATLQTSCGALLFPHTAKTKDAGRVNVVSTPPDALILLNGTPVGKTPMVVPINTEAELSSNKKDNVIQIVKDGYQPKMITLVPKEETVSKSRPRFWFGLAEVGTGLALSTIPPKIDPTTGKPTNGSDLLTLLTSYFIVFGGIEAYFSLTSKNPSTLTTRHYDQYLSEELESNATYAARVEEEKERKREAQFRAVLLEKAQAEQARKAQEEAEQNRQIERANSKLKFASLQEGDMICAKEASCKKYNPDDCLGVSAFIEKWNADRSKYQIRIHSVHSGSITYTDPSGPYTELDGIRYHKGAIIWIDPFERQNTIWITCKNR